MPASPFYGRRGPHGSYLLSRAEAAAQYEENVASRGPPTLAAGRPSWLPLPAAAASLAAAAASGGGLLAQPRGPLSFTQPASQAVTSRSTPGRRGRGLGANQGALSLPGVRWLCNRSWASWLPRSRVQRLGLMLLLLSGAVAASLLLRRQPGVSRSRSGTLVGESAGLGGGRGHWEDPLSSSSSSANRSWSLDGLMQSAAVRTSRGRWGLRAADVASRGQADATFRALGEGEGSRQAQENEARDEVHGERHAGDGVQGSWSLSKFGRGSSAIGDRRPDIVRPPKLSDLPPPRKNWNEGSRVALCLIGGARDFHLTGPTISRHLLLAYPDSDAFVLAPLDDNSHKLSLLAAMVPNLVAVRIAADVPVNETSITDRLLMPIKGGPETPEAQTRQGLMQQFKSVEMCVSAISSFERKHAFKYKWVLRTRVDGYWMGPPPPLKVLDPGAYTIPGGSDWGGLNDRLGVGTRNVSWLALRRLSVLPDLVEKGGFENLNAERVYLAQMRFLQVRIARYDFPFCILSRKKGMPAFPVAAALSSTAALNGAKCRPCKATVVGKAAADYVAALPERIFGSVPYGIDLCLAESSWGEDWQAIFDEAAGPQGAAVREYIDTRSFQECVRDWNEFKPVVPVWDAPPPEPLCVRGQLGKFRKLGYPGGDFPVFIDPFLPPRVTARARNPIVYSVGVGLDYAFDWAVIRKLKALRCRVQAFDSTPNGLRWVVERFENLPPESFVHHPWLLGPEDKPLTVYEMDLEEHPVEYATRLPPDMDPTTAAAALEVPALTLETSMQRLNHTWVDILRLGGHHTLHEDIFESWFRRGKAPPVCQIIVCFHKGDKHYSSSDPRTRRELLLLRELGYELGACIRKDQFYESCVFFSVHHCQYDV